MGISQSLRSTHQAKLLQPHFCFGYVFKRSALGRGAVLQVIKLPPPMAKTSRRAKPHHLVRGRWLLFLTACVEALRPQRSPMQATRVVERLESLDSYPPITGFVVKATVHC